MDALEDILIKYWGHSTFRPLQKDIIQEVLNGKDALAILPTGGGKSLCFQLPALAQNGFCIVVSPLIALMKDQVDNLHAKNISAAHIDSTMSVRSIEKVLIACTDKTYQFLYVSPERLHTETFQAFVHRLPVTLVAIDEAHCISQWGHDFRPQYLKLHLCKEFFPNVPLIALTASATPKVKKEICSVLKIAGCKEFVGSFERKNLSYSTFNEDIKIKKATQILTNVKGSGIVYVATRRDTITVSNHLQAKGFSCDFYHAGMTGTQKQEKQEKWKSGKIETMVCTNAFGMGIDKPDVRKVVHYHIPETIEQYYQEAGRAGRDEKKSYAILLFTEKDIGRTQQKFKEKFPPQSMVRKVYAHLLKHSASPNTEQPNNTSRDPLALETISQALAIPQRTLYHVFKILDKLEFVQYEENYFRHSQAEIIVSKSYIKDFLELHPKYKDVYMYLARKYAGIFDLPVYINEEEIAQDLKIALTECQKMLLEMHTHTVLWYSQKINGTYLKVLPPPTTREEFTQKWNSIEQWQKNNESKLKNMLEFTQQTTTCRAFFIENYFLENDTKKTCGICDVCLAKKKKKTN